MTNSHPDERSMRERMLAGDLYLADDPQLAAESVARSASRIGPTRWTRRRTKSDAPCCANCSEPSGTTVRPPAAAGRLRIPHDDRGAHVRELRLHGLDVAEVTIGENTVVGAGSIVTKDLAANVVAVGNPARVVREI